MRLRGMVRRVYVVLAACIVTMLIVAIAIVLRAYAIKITYEWHGPLSADSSLYLAVGRGILNGLIPYRDLFETKPPGIYLLSSLALLVRDGTSGTGVIQALALLGMPIVLAWHVWMRAGKTRLRWILCACGGLLGMLLGLYAQSRSGQFQVESIGAFFGMLYVVAIDARETDWNRRRLLLATIGLLGAIGLKEPFFLSTFASALILWHEHPRQVLRRFVLPLCIAAAAGTMILLLLGHFESLVNIYIPEVFFRFGMERHIPWKRILMLTPSMRSMVRFSIPLAILLYSAAGLVLWNSLQQRYTTSLLRTVSGIGLLVIAAFLLSLGNLLGNTAFPHHYVIAVPGYAAIALRLFAMLHTAQKRWLLATVITLLFAASLRFAAAKRIPHTPAMPPRRAAEKIDAILDACGQSRYLFLGWNGKRPYAFTEHSPLGPAFIQFGFYLDEQRAFLRDSYVRNLHETFLAVRRIKHDNDTNKATRPLSGIRYAAEQYIAHAFTITPPPCASALPYATREGGYEYLFRR